MLDIIHPAGENGKAFFAGEPTASRSPRKFRFTGARLFYSAIAFSNVLSMVSPLYSQNIIPAKPVDFT